MIWLTLDMVETFHRESLARFGGADGVRDPGLLESAMAWPQNLHSYEPQADVFSLAAAYAFGLIKNHPFVDGNKRTGILSTVVFLALNGVEIEVEEAAIVAMVIGLAASDIDEARFAEWLRGAAVS